MDDPFDIGGFLSLEDNQEPSDYEMLLFFFFEHGVTLEEFNRLPIPYILSMMRVYSYTHKDKK